MLPGVADADKLVIGASGFLGSHVARQLVEPFFLRDMATEVVGIEDAATALLLAADHGRVGERYIVSERWLPYRELYETAARAAGRRAPRWGIPKSGMRAMGVLGSIAGTVARRYFPLNRTTERLMHLMSPMDHGKAVRELGWRPRSVHDSIRQAVEFFDQRHRRRTG